MAGLLRGLAGLTVALGERRRGPLAAVALPAGLVVVPLTVLFPEGGSEPFPLVSFVVTVVVVVVFLVGLPRGEGLSRFVALVYLGACVLCLLVTSPVGSNIERYGVLLAGPLLVWALLRERPWGLRAPVAGGVFIASRGRFSRPGLGAAGMLSLAAIATWVLWGPIRETAAGDGRAAASA